MHYNQYACILTWDISPLSSLTLLLLESSSLYSKLRWLFHFYLLKSQLMILIFEGYDTNFYLKCCQLYPTFFVFLEKESWSYPYYVFFFYCPQPDHAPKFFIRVFFRYEVVWKKIWLFIRSCFHGEFLEFQSSSKHKNHFDVGLRQTCFEEIQVIPMDMSS